MKYACYLVAWIIGPSVARSPSASAGNNLGEPSVPTDPTSRLTYSLRSRNPHDTFEEAEWRGSLGRWAMQLSNGRLEAIASQPIPEGAKARNALEPLLRAWEAVAFLQGHYDIEFRHDESEGAQPPDRPSSDPVGSQSLMPHEDHIFRRSNSTYPAPDASFTRTPLVEQLLLEIAAFRSRQKSLPDVVHAILAAMASAAEGSVDDIASVYNVAPEVIETLSDVADRPQTVDGPASMLRRYRGVEWQWMQEAIKLLTLQAGRAAAGRPVNQLNMDDFGTKL